MQNNVSFSSNGDFLRCTYCHALFLIPLPRGSNEIQHSSIAIINPCNLPITDSRLKAFIPSSTVPCAIQRLSEMMDCSLSVAT